MGHLLDALTRGYDVLSLRRAAGADEVFGQLVLARIIEPVSKLESLRLLAGGRGGAGSYATLKRRLPTHAKDSWRQALRVFAAEIPGTAASRSTSPSSGKPVTAEARCYPEPLRPPA